MYVCVSIYVRKLFKRETDRQTERKEKCRQQKNEIEALFISKSNKKTSSTETK